MSGRDEQHEGPARDIARTFTPNPRPENEPFLGRPTENRNICLGQQQSNQSLLTSTASLDVIVLPSLVQCLGYMHRDFHLWALYFLQKMFESYAV